MARAAVAASAVFALFGGLLVLGGLAALQSDTPDLIDETVKPYRFVWFIWSFEVFVVLFAVAALAVDYNAMKNPLMALVSIVTVLVINLINAIIYDTASLPGSNGSATRGNVAVAGLIIVAIGNAFIIFTTALFNLSPAAKAPSKGAELDKGVEV